MSKSTTFERTVGIFWFLLALTAEGLGYISIETATMYLLFAIVLFLIAIEKRLE